MQVHFRQKFPRQAKKLKNPIAPNRIEIVAAIMTETISFNLFVLGFTDAIMAIIMTPAKNY